MGVPYQEGVYTITPQHDDCNGCRKAAHNIMTRDEGLWKGTATKPVRGTAIYYGNLHSALVSVDTARVRSGR